MVHQTFADRLRGAMNKGAEGAPAKKDVITSMSFKDAMAGAFSHDPYANKMFQERTMLPIMKSLGTVDLSALRLVSVSDRTAVKRNDDTRFLNWLEARGNFPTIRDYQFRIKERDALSGTPAPVFNLDDASALPAVHQSTWSARYNTLTTLGFRTSQSMLSQDMVAQQGQDDVAEAEMQDVASLIRRGENSILISNTEVTSEAVGQIPQLGGFVTRSTANAQAAGAAPLTEAMLQDAIEDILETHGYDKQLGIMCNPQYVAEIDDFMINKYPGTDPMTHFERQSAMLAKAMVDASVPYGTVYMDRRAKPVPVFHDPMMAAGSLIVFIMNDNQLTPRLAEYKFQGQGGIHALVLPTASAHEVALLFSIITLDDPMVSGRVRITGLA
jgi:hypothetical protein